MPCPECGLSWRVELPPQTVPFRPLGPTCSHCQKQWPCGCPAGDRMLDAIRAELAKPKTDPAP
jgi:hypothetical protein